MSEKRAVVRAGALERYIEARLDDFNKEMGQKVDISMGEFHKKYLAPSIAEIHVVQEVLIDRLAMAENELAFLRLPFWKRWAVRFRERRAARRGPVAESPTEPAPTEEPQPA